MIPSVFGLKGMAIAAVLSGAVAFTTGWKLRDTFCDAAEARAQVAHLQRQIDAQAAAARADAELFPAQEKDLSAVEATTDALKNNQISAGECFTAGDVDRLRKLWPE